MSGNLPKAIRIMHGRSQDDRPVVRCDIGGLTQPANGRSWPPGNDAVQVNVTSVVTPTQARAWAAELLIAADIAEGLRAPQLVVHDGGRE